MQHYLPFIFISSIVAYSNGTYAYDLSAIDNAYPLGTPMSKFCNKIDCSKINGGKYTIYSTRLYVELQATPQGILYERNIKPLGLFNVSDMPKACKQFTADVLAYFKHLPNGWQLDTNSNDGQSKIIKIINPVGTKFFSTSYRVGTCGLNEVDYSIYNDEISQAIQKDQTNIYNTLNSDINQDLAVNIPGNIPIKLGITRFSTIENNYESCDTDKFSYQYTCKNKGNTYRFIVSSNGTIIHFGSDDPQLTDEKLWMNLNKKYTEDEQILPTISSYSPPKPNNEAGNFMFVSGKAARSEKKEVYANSHKALLSYEDNRIAYLQLLEKESKKKH